MKESCRGHLGRRTRMRYRALTECRCEVAMLRFVKMSEGSVVEFSPPSAHSSFIIQSFIRQFILPPSDILFLSKMMSFLIFDTTSVYAYSVMHVRRILMNGGSAFSTIERDRQPCATSANGGRVAALRRRAPSARRPPPALYLLRLTDAGPLTFETNAPVAIRLLVDGSDDSRRAAFEEGVCLKNKE
ncbi:hypothetical protein EVAR_5152_1 [Eumeta japonica]|uniref:Uncharacterized protein n=1 Tax=Eumeta variegata TaxID=151549 RepID=A0A4C1SUF0_EUMVA|nr:hypothetical protein EVAR_5152_1 [Eumeta japonica]